MPTQPEIRVLNTPADLFQAAATEFVGLAAQSVRNSGRFTLPVLNRSACVMFLVSGGDKANIVREVLKNEDADLPSQKVHPVNGRLLWLLYRAAGGGLS